MRRYCCCQAIFLLFQQRKISSFCQINLDAFALQLQGLITMTLLVVVLVSVYLLFARYFFKIWLRFFERDTEMTLEERRLSWAVLLIGTLVWPLVVPISYLTLLEKKLKNQEASSGRDKVVDISDDSDVNHSKHWTVHSYN